MLPQLDVNTYYSQIFWLFVCFFCLYLFINIFFIPKISNVVVNRKEHIDILIAEAEIMKNEAQKILQDAIDYKKTAASEAELLFNKITEDHKIVQTNALNQISKKYEQDYKALLENVNNNNLFNDHEYKNLIITQVLLILKSLGIDSKMDINSIYDKIAAKL